MRRKLLFLILLLSLSPAVLAEPIIYELVKSDGQVLARTEVMPSVGDAYWDAITDDWYTVLSVKGTRALVGTQTETKRFFMERNLRLAVGAGVVLVSAAWYMRRRLRSRRRSQD